MASVAVFNHKGELLFGLRHDVVKWVLPGGKIEPNEAPAAAAAREVAEESGLTITHLAPIGEGAIDNAEGFWRIYAFRAIAEGIPHGNNDPDKECLTWRWVNVNQGLPNAIASNLYSPNNVTLRLLGLQMGEIMAKTEALEKGEWQPHIPGRTMWGEGLEARKVTLPLPALTGADKPRTPEHVQHYVSRLQEKRGVAPITVVHDGKQYHVLDGHHRLAAHQQLGLSHIQAHEMRSVTGDNTGILEVWGKGPFKKSEPLTKMALVRNDPTKPKTVYRVQNAEGLGPYQAAAEQTGEWPPTSLPDGVHHDSHEFYRPLPEDDFEPHEYQEGTEDGLAYGFEHPKHAERWFGPGGLRQLYEKGFRVKAVPASKVLRSVGGGQVMFEHHPSAFSANGMPAAKDAPEVDGFKHPLPAPKVRPARTSSSIPGQKKPRTPKAVKMKKSEPLIKMAIADIKPGKKLKPSPDGFEKTDYSHLLSPDHRALGYKLHVFDKPSLQGDGSRLVRAGLVHPSGKTPLPRMSRGEVGVLTGLVKPNDSLKVGAAEVAEPHRGGKGVPLYEALYAHAKHKHGAFRAYGDTHSTLASAVHQKLATKHGLEYQPTPNYGPGQSTAHWETKPEWQEALTTGENDERYAPYSYALKSEANAIESQAKQVVKPTPESLGYTFTVRHLKDKAGNIVHTSVGAFHPDAYAQTGDDRVGAVDFSHMPDDSLVSDNTWVHDDHQRRGVGRRMYQLASEATGKDIEPSSLRTQDGANFWLGKSNLTKMASPTPTFPKMGLGDDRRETPYVTNKQQLRTKVGLVMAANVHHPRNQDVPKSYLAPKLRDLALDRYQAIASHKSGTRGESVGGSTGVQTGYALAGDAHPAGKWATNATTGTKLHEDMHLHFNRVEAKHGVMGRMRLASNLYHAIPAQHRAAIDKYQDAMGGAGYANSPIVHEEKLARLLNYMNSGHDRETFHQSLNQLEDPAYDKNTFDTHMKRAYKALRAASDTADDTWATQHKMHLYDDVAKAEADGIESFPSMAKAEAATIEGLAKAATGYAYTHSTKDHGEKHDHLYVEAHHNGQKVGSAEFKRKGANHYSVGLHVEPEHRRKGVATGIYAHAEKVSGRKVVPSTDQTTLGRLFSQGRRKKLQKAEKKTPPK